ncbi:hypothetical protein ACV4QK_21245 (plasmid) [Alteromonas macleodii]|jgi:hypothetical protein
MTVFCVVILLLLFGISVINSAAAKYDERVQLEQNKYENLRKEKAMYLQPMPGSGTGPNIKTPLDISNEKALAEQRERELLRKKKAMFLQPMPGDGTFPSRFKK